MKEHTANLHWLILRGDNSFNQIKKNWFPR